MGGLLFVCLFVRFEYKKIVGSAKISVDSSIKKKENCEVKRSAHPDRINSQRTQTHPENKQTRDYFSLPPSHRSPSLLIHFLVVILRKILSLSLSRMMIVPLFYFLIHSFHSHSSVVLVFFPILLTFTNDSQWHQISKCVLVRGRKYLWTLFFAVCLLTVKP